MTRLSIIMPMYNSEDIETNLKEATKILDEVGNYELIAVDDGSTNNCIEQARKFKHSRVKVVGYKKNAGKGNAIKYGFNFTKGEYVAFIDSGRDLNPKQLRDFLEIIEREKADVVIGSKRHSESEVHYPLMRRLMSWAYQHVNRVLFNIRIRDTQVGLKLFKRKVLEEALPKIVIKRFAFDLELLIIANKYHFKIVEAPITIRYRFKSSINLKAVLGMLLDTMALFYRLKILRWYD